MMKLKTITITAWLLWLCLPVVAQEKSDTTYVFRFLPAKDAFLTSCGDNLLELDRMLGCVAQYQEAILSGRMPLYVDGYCNSLENEQAALAVAKIRSNRVKSELIVRQGLTEDCFVTHNHASEGDYVTVRLIVPTEPVVEETASQQPATEECSPAERPQAEVPCEALDEKSEMPAEATADQGVSTESAASAHHFAIRANLLRWATLTPDLGIEWRICDRWSLGVNGSWTSWTWKNNGGRYALWEVSPEVRLYLGQQRAWFVGAIFKAGQFNYQLCPTGRQGDLMGGGITGGYQLRLSRSLAMDFSIGVGYLQADYEKYETIDGIRVRRGNETKDWWGPVNAGVTLVWKLF